MLRLLLATLLCFAPVTKTKVLLLAWPILQKLLLNVALAFTAIERVLETSSTMAGSCRHIHLIEPEYSPLFLTPDLMTPATPF
jgi:hypothetical protein